MPVTFTVADHLAAPVVESRKKAVDDAAGLLRATLGTREDFGELLQSTFSDTTTDFSNVIQESNEFVQAVIKAYNEHHHLVLRPDDVWIAILSQFSAYVNAHADELREHFVAHEDQKFLEVEAIGNRYTLNFGVLARQMAELIDQNVVDKNLRDWILPNFSTTTHNDTVVSSVLMMATLKAYFSYGLRARCGLPSVSLQGERADWVKLLHRIDKLNSFGEEPKAWARLLRPILTRFVTSFDGTPDLDFWGKICHYHRGGSGIDFLSGWITAFTVWSNQGKWQGPSLDGDGGHVLSTKILQLELDSVAYSHLSASRIPSGCCEVDVRLDDNGEIFNCMMVSGHVARVTGGENRDTLKPLPAWFMFTKAR